MRKKDIDLPGLLLITSSYYCIYEYMKFGENIFVLLICNPNDCPVYIRNNDKILITTDFTIGKVAEAIRNSGFKISSIISLDDKFVDKINELVEIIGIKSNQNYGSLSRDKKELKVEMEKNKIKYPKTLSFGNRSDLEKHHCLIEYPTIVKPSNSYGSNGVFLVENYDQLIKCASAIDKRNTFQKKYFNDENCSILVEEYIMGTEYAVDLIWYDGKPICELVSSRLHAKNTNMFPDYVYYYDWKLNENMKSEIVSTAKKVGEAIGIKCGSTHTEMREKNGEFYVLENAVRPGGGGCMFKLHSLYTGMNYFEVFCNSNIGIKPELTEFTKNKSTYYFFLTYANCESGIVKNIGFKKDVLDHRSKIFSVEYLVKEGDKILSNDITMRYTIFVYGSIEVDTIEEFEAQIDNINKACVLTFE